MKSIADRACFTGARALIASMALILGGCSALQAPPASAVYDFGPGAGMPSVAAARGPSTLSPVLLDTVHVRAALDGTAMHYRLAYADAQQLRPYAQARWSMAPAELLHQRVRDQLAAQRTLLQDGQGLSIPVGALHLYLELDEFSQVFANPTDSAGLVRVQATLGRREANGERWLAQRSFAVERPAPTGDASGGAKALRAASDALVAELNAWLQTVEPAPAR